MNRTGSSIAILLAAMSLTVTEIWAQPTTTAGNPEVAVKAVTEDRQKLIQATVTLNGKPLEGVTVEFFVQRTFGQLAIGQDKTLDDGTAAAPFPTGLPAGPSGQLRVFATITAPPQFARSRGEMRIESGQVSIRPAVSPPRALWAPRAPALLVATISLVVLSVWGCYIYVVAQLVAIGYKR